VIVAKFALIPVDTLSTSEVIPTAFLLRHQFEVIELIGPGVPVIQANKNSCRMVLMFLAEAAEQTWKQEKLANLAQPSDRLFYVFRGSVRNHVSRWIISLNGAWARMLRRFSIPNQLDLVLLVMAGPSCDLEGLPWEELLAR
jgi:hypothetical protein